MQAHLTNTAVQAGWFGIERGDWLAAITNMLAVIIAVFIAAKIAPWADERRARRDQQERLLRVLISTGPMPANPEYQGAIGLIPIDFKGYTRVLNARKAYLDVVNVAAPTDPKEQAEHFKETAEKQADLIAAIAQELGFDLTSEAFRAGGYVSKGFVDREELILEAMRSWPRIAMALERNNHMFAYSIGALPEQQPQQEADDKSEVRVEGNGER